MSRMGGGGGGAGGGGRASGSVTRSPDSPLFERRAGLGGPTTRGRPATAPRATPAASRPVTVASIIPDSSSVVRGLAG